MKYNILIPSFSLGFLALLFSTIFFPHLRLLPFAPFLAIAFNRTSFVKSLWLSLLCGICIDLFSSEIRFGVASLNCCITTACLYHQKKHFFEDKPLALSLFTVAISLFSTILQFVLLNVFGKDLSLSWQLIATDFIGMPLVDGAYAFFWFTCPLKFYNHVRKVGIRALFKKVAQEDEPRP